MTYCAQSVKTPSSEFDPAAVQPADMEVHFLLQPEYTSMNDDIHVEGRLPGLLCVLMGYFSRRTPASPRRIGDSSLNHENAPTGDRGSINMDTVWEERMGVKKSGCALSASAIWMKQTKSDSNMLKACCSTTL